MGILPPASGWLQTLTALNSERSIFPSFLLLHEKYRIPKRWEVAKIQEIPRYPRLCATFKTTRFIAILNCDNGAANSVENYLELVGRMRDSQDGSLTGPNLGDFCAIHKNIEWYPCTHRTFVSVYLNAHVKYWTT